VDTFVTTVIAGVIVALAGGVAGFYLNRQREKEVRLGERRVTALDEMSAQCRSVVGAYEN
jgi:hypothetical protein